MSRINFFRYLDMLVLFIVDNAVAIAMFTGGVFVFIVTSFMGLDITDVYFSVVFFELGIVATAVDSVRVASRKPGK